MNNVITAERDQVLLLPPDLRQWLPQDHLAVFIGDIVDKLDLHELENQYRGSGKAAFSPSLLLSLLFYGYATGVFSSRKIEQSTYDSVAFRYLSGDTHPDHDTIAAFRRRFLPQLKSLFVQILLIARELGCLRMGTVAIDGTKIKANASKHKAMSWGYACRLEKQLHREIDKLLHMAEEADMTGEEQDIDIPEEIRFRQQRLARIAEAKKALEQRAAQRHERAVELWEQRKRNREQQQKKSGKPPKGSSPRHPRSGGPEKKDQYNFTDPESRIMKTHGSFEQCQNAQAAVDVESRLIVGTELTNSGSDAHCLLSTLRDVERNAGLPGSVLADSGYFSEENFEGCCNRKIEAYIGVGRQKHNSRMKTRNGKRPPQNMSPARKEMWKRLNSEFGRILYSVRMSTVEPAFGFIKHVMGFRQFMTRGMKKNAGEWDLICLAYDLRRMFQLKPA